MSNLDKAHFMIHSERFMIHSERFMILPNTLINSMEISFKAKGIMAYLLSKPDVPVRIH